MGFDLAGKVPGLRNRFLLFSLFATAIFLLLLCRLWYLQIISVDRYRLLSEKNRIRHVPIAAPRGPIFDRAGRLLVDNRPSFDISIMRQDVEDRQLLLRRLAVYLDTEVEELEARWQEGRRFPVYRPITVADDVDRTTMDRVQEHSVDLAGLLIEVHPARAYSYGDSAAHLFGYLGEVTEKEMRELAEQGYRAGELIGKSGIEGLLESHLRGAEGLRRLEVDVKGKELRQTRVREPVPGHRVYLTLDRDLQLAAETAFGDQAGAAAALDVETGEVLALVSRPAFDPSLFARGITGSEWIDLLQDPRHPLQDKSIKGQYPPGSTFKIVVALAALEAGVAAPAFTVDCEGAFTLGDSEFRCWKKEGHGRTNLKKALRESCDIWFYRVGLELGIERLSAMAFDLGLGRPTGIALQGEKAGLIPTRQWKRKRFNAPWYDGETVIAAIGQGYVLTTPLQLAVMTAAVANGGKVLRPLIVKRIEDWQGNVHREARTEVLHTARLGEESLAPVRQGLVAVVNEPHGTGWATRLERLAVAGKTGTSQVVRRKSDEEEEEEDEEEIPYRFRDHGLFVAYAPAQDPQIAVAVVVEHGRHGSTAAAPIARAMFESYFGFVDEEPATTPSVLGD